MAEGLQKVWVRVGLCFLAGVVFTTIGVSSCAPLKKKSTESSVNVDIPSRMETVPTRTTSKDAAEEPATKATAADSTASVGTAGTGDSSKPAVKKKSEKLTQLAPLPSERTDLSANTADTKAAESARPSLAVAPPAVVEPKVIAPVIVAEPKPEIPVQAAIEPKPAEKTVVASQSSSSLSSPEVSMGHPSAAIPIPDDVRLQAGKALEEGKRREEAAAAKKQAAIASKSKPADQHGARARLNDSHETLPHVSQRQFYLEVAFIALVLFCLIGAMWYRLNSDFGRGPRRRIDR